MSEVVYTFTPDHLKIYQRLTSDRASGQGHAGSWDKEFLRFMLAALATAAILAVADLGVPLITGRPFAYAEFLLGLVAGFAMMLGAMWWRYGQMRKRAVRPDGPTMSEHRMSLTPEGVRVASRLHDVHYRWLAIDDLTIHDEVIVLWVEPAAGALIPRSAFPDRAAEERFVASVRGHIARA